MTSSRSVIALLRLSGEGPLIPTPGLATHGFRKPICGRLRVRRWWVVRRAVAGWVAGPPLRDLADDGLPIAVGRRPGSAVCPDASPRPLGGLCGAGAGVRHRAAFAGGGAPL